MEPLIYAAGVLVFTIVVTVLVLLMLVGAYTLYVGLRCKKSAGSKLDLTAFWFNFLGWMWMWAERIEEIIAAHPHWEKDLSETLGYKKDDGRIT